MKSTDIALVLIMNITFGAAFISAKIGVNYFPPFLFTSMRFLIIAILLLPFLKLHQGQMFNILFISLLGGAFHFAFFYLALDNSTHISSVAIFLQLGTPFATILSVIFLGEIIRWKRLLGIFLAFAGVVILIFEPTIFSDLGGVYYALLAAFSISVSLLFMKKLKNIKVFDLQVWIAWTSFVFLAIISFIVEDNQILIIQSASINAWIAVIFTAIVATGIGHAGFYYLLTKYDVSRITPLTLLAPVLAIVNALIITYFSIFDGFDETITLKILLGGSLTLIGVAIVMIREKENKVVSTV